jgi:cytoskeletal protein RodZ
MSETIGQTLRNARQERNLSLEEAAEETHIRVNYLEALEKGDLDQLPSQAHARGFIPTNR